MKYDYEDIIVDPKDERVEIGAEYFAAITPAACLRCANSGAQAAELKYVERDKDRPFFLADAGWSCVIRKKEPETKLVPFDFSDPKDRDFLRGKWVRMGDENNSIEGQILGFSLIGLTKEDRVEIGAYGWVIAEIFLDLWKFLDGSPCGKEVEE